MVVSHSSILPVSGLAIDGTALALLRIPYSFTQDQLLNSKEFIDEAKQRGQVLSLIELEQLYSYRLLIPLYWISDTQREEWKIEVEETWAQNSRGRAFLAASEGKLVDCGSEKFSTARPFQLPLDQNDRHWWNGYLYSFWQLSDLEHALQRLRLVSTRGELGNFDVEWAERDRRRTLSLVAISTCFLPEIRGVMTDPIGGKFEEMWAFRHGAEVLDLLQVVAFDIGLLKTEAIWLLANADARDPMLDWWPLIRHSNSSGWNKIRGTSRDCLWQRIAAEMFLRVHEDLVHQNMLEPLPDLNHTKFRHPLHSRITPRELNAKPIEFELAANGLFPNPRVLLLIEGHTELTHISKLLEEFDLLRPNRVRIQNCQGSEINPQLISRYAITPRLGPRMDSVQLVTPPTALIIAMDPEGRWSTKQKVARERRNLQSAIREEVEWQFKALAQDEVDWKGKTILQEDLDFLVTIFIWGKDKYEIANFTDEELEWALTEFANEQAQGLTTSQTWESEVRLALKKARSQHLDIGIVFGRLKLKEGKKRFAEILMPVLLRKLATEMANDSLVTPVFQLIQKIRELDGQLSGGSYSLRV